MAFFQESSTKKSRARSCAVAALSLLLAAAASQAFAAEPAPAAPPAAADKLKISAQWRQRVEVWDFFEPSGAAGANNNYDFYGSDLRAQIAWNDDWFDLFVEGQGVALAGLPENSTGVAPTEGPLGGGAVYRSNNGDDGTEFSGYIRQASLKWKKLGVPGLWIKGGRQVFADGKEVAPTDPTLTWLKSFRVAERLIGPFDYTYAGRSFDSALVNYSRGPLSFTGFYGKPTQGGFHLDVMETIESIDLAYASMNLLQPEWSKTTAGRLFYIYYGDNRPLVKLDNRPLPARQADTGDISIHTIGADVEHVVPTGIGNIDLLGWFTYQAGDYGVLDHSAWALAVEAGIQPSALPWKPWLRAGYNIGSGDDDNSDGDHETFFQILPTPRVYALSTFYNMMNTQDAFLQLILKPLPGLVWRTDFHLLRLSENDDLWYFGGGATREHSQPGFGFGGRPSGNQSSLMEVLETQLTYNWKEYLSTTLYYGHGFGEDVVGADFPNGKDANYGYLEITLKLPPT